MLVKKKLFVTFVWHAITFLVYFDILFDFEIKKRKGTSRTKKGKKKRNRYASTWIEQGSTDSESAVLTTLLSRHHTWRGLKLILHIKCDTKKKTRTDRKLNSAPYWSSNKQSNFKFNKWFIQFTYKYGCYSHFICPFWIGGWPCRWRSGGNPYFRWRCTAQALNPDPIINPKVQLIFYTPFQARLKKLIPHYRQTGLSTLPERVAQTRMDFWGEHTPPLPLGCKLEDFEKKFSAI